GWERMFREVQLKCASDAVFKSDENPHYPSALRKVFPKNHHERFKGRRGCVVGQGELKAGEFDPLFSLNHTCAMLRDNLKTLARKTWCTVKKIASFNALLKMYAWYHNHVRLARPARQQQ